MLPWERSTRWQRPGSASGNLDLNARWVELSATSRVLGIERVGFMERDNLNAENILSWCQISGDGNPILYGVVQLGFQFIRKTAKAYLSSVAQQLFDGPGARVTLVEDLDPDTTLTIRACRCEVCNFKLC